VYASKRGGTAGIAQGIRDVLVERDFDADAVAVDHASSLDRYDAVIVGGALYAMRWRRSARRFVRRNAQALARIPVWFFSSGPLDTSASEREIPPVGQVRALMERVHARGHTTFGGRLAPDAQGFPASAMAKKNAGDWRDPEHIRRWANEIADALVSTIPATSE